MRLLRQADYRRMPWRNGGGQTAEIAVYPENGTFENFGWRVSMATIERDGPFSIIEHADRTLAVLSEAGMELEVAGHGAHVLTRESEPFFFPADAPAAATLPSGTVTDLNVMTRRGAFGHVMSRLSVSGPARLDTTARWEFLVPLEDCRLATNLGDLRLRGQDTLLVQPGDELAINPHGKAVNFLSIRIAPVT